MPNRIVPAAQKIDAVLLRESLRGRGPTYVFGDAGVEIHKTEAPMLPEAIAGAFDRADTLSAPTSS